MPKIFGGADATKLPLAGGTMTGGVVLHTSGNKLTNTSLTTNTSDGSDNAYAGIHGGGAEAVGRGGALYVYGNEYTGAQGWVDVQAGNASGSKIRLRNAGLTIGEVAATGLSMNYPITLSGNVSSAGSTVRNVHGGGNANDFVVNVPSGGRLVFAANGTEQTEISTSQGVVTNFLQISVPTGYVSSPRFVAQGNNPFICGGSSYPYDGAKLYLYTIGHATYPGANQSFAPLTTRAASTAIAVCPVATGDMAYVTILESSIASCKVKVDTAGTVTFTDLDGNAASASIVNSSSPAAAEYGVYISAGILYFKGGSSYAGKMSSFSQIGKA